MLASDVSGGPSAYVSSRYMGELQRHSGPSGLSEYTTAVTGGIPAVPSQCMLTFTAAEKCMVMHIWMQLLSFLPFKIYS